MSDVFDRVVYQYAVFPNKRFREKVWDTFVSTLNSLDETQRRILLYREKFDIERRIESSDFLSREWEELWLQNINCCSKLVLIGSCENCRQTYPIVVDYYKYKEDGILLEDTMPVLEMDCQKCKAKGKLLTSTWDKKHT